MTADKAYPIPKKSGDAVMPQKRPSSVVAICTKDRPDDLRKALQSVLPEINETRRLLIVDASSAENSLVGCDQTINSLGSLVSVLRCSPGLTHQRNKALDSLFATDQFIHFIDDDVEIERGYFLHLEQFLEENPSFAGCGGWITNLPARSRLYRFNPLNWAPNRGPVLRSGVNLFRHAKKDHGFVRVDWLSGCSMTFNTARIFGLRFDERRQGVGTGEDVDFSLRALQRGPLARLPKARLAHHKSPTNRADAFNAAVSIVRHRFSLADDSLHDITAIRVTLRFLLEIVIYLCSGTIKRDRGLISHSRGIARGLSERLLRG